MLCQSSILSNLIPLSLPMKATMKRKDEEVSLIEREKSPKCVERSSMSSADDVLEMKTLTNLLADLMVGTAALVKERVGAVLDAINADASEPISANRAGEFLSGKARQILAWEKENAKRRVAELKRARERQREQEHLLWIEEQIGRHRASGEELRGPMVDGLQHFLRLARDPSGAVALHADEAEGAAE
jgi:hypothetical protein